MRNLASYFTATRIELILLALALAITVVTSSLTLSQTTRHFRIQRTSDFVARFNSFDMVALREAVDRWLESRESPAALYSRSKQLPATSATQVADAAHHPSPRDEALGLVGKLRTLTNYFQELGTALKHDNLDEQYLMDLLGAVCVRYGDSLMPFISETRSQRQRPNAYAEALWLRDEMVRLDPSLSATPIPGK